MTKQDMIREKIKDVARQAEKIDLDPAEWIATLIVEYARSQLAYVYLSPDVVTQYQFNELVFHIVYAANDQIRKIRDEINSRN